MDPVSILVSQIHEADLYLKKASRQVALLNNKISSTRCHFKRACRDDRRKLAWKRSMQLSTYEGVRQMYFEYSERKCREIEVLSDALWKVAGVSYEDVVNMEGQGEVNL